MNNHLREQLFRKRKNVINVVSQFLDSRKKDFFEKGMYKLVIHWEHAIEADENYFQE